MVIDALNPPEQWDSGGKVLGNPQNAVEDLQQIYKVITVFRTRFNRYPTSSMELQNDMVRNLGTYGYSAKDQIKTVFTNPDVIHSPNPIFRQNPSAVIPYQMPSTRFDGQPISAPKPQGQRDVLAMTNLYYFPNTKVNWTNFDASTRNPVGFYVVLWDDGQVEKIPFDKALYVPQDNKEQGSWGFGFPGQAGLNPGVKTYDEFNKDDPTYKKWKRAQMP